MSIASVTVHLEGTTLEGGGQILRLALSLSSLTRTPIHISNIRGKRHGGGGLKSQHLTSLKWLGQACNASTTGAQLKSKEITFAPDTAHRNDTVKTGAVEIKQDTPGSVNLVFQAVLPYLLFSGAEEKIRLTITGGTNVSNSPSYDYIAQVLIPMLTLIGAPSIETELHARGWSQGGTCLGRATYTITPLRHQLPAFHLIERGAMRSVNATIIAPKDTEQHFRDELDVMFDNLEPRISTPPATITFDTTFEDSHHPKRYYILLVATTTTGMKLGRDWLFDQAIRPGKTEHIVPTMVRKVAGDLMREIEHEGCVDEFLRDQLVVFQALALSGSRVEGGKGKLSMHALTARWVAEQILGVEFSDDGSCGGVGYHPGGAGEDRDVNEELVGELERVTLGRG
ncbi:RNA 3'-terminal phosphate cyclase [Dothidotthia symphoricarpi CBS 119687]|uniref:RNA 3'-terminal phosphate cyclase n=1 Tax=Dothidotthia symphoricarpi CBS 119687 TaxID=1392245 RepID=A0A6A6AUP4_9PLEO|nr:RNA 3'-terminal phosphate cyclase [Dothidotthia symphoricarpi CBS 119687]KAF2134685.1 RNA 3'-terminal phosphate cyclase [Dothidotthia symphoricarpi CBS 119687]